MKLEIKETDWIPTEKQRPPEGEIVLTKNGGQIQKLVFERNLWWFPDRSMYLYYTPQLWKAV